jgi:uncharacterized membrane protein
MNTISHAISWGLPQLIIAVLAVITARRYRWISLRILAAAAILHFFTKFIISAVAAYCDPAPPYGLMTLDSYSGFAVFVLAVVGWSMLAFTRQVKESHDA